MAETVIQAVDTTFARQGYSLQQKGYLLPTNVNTFLTSAMSYSAQAQTLAAGVNNALYGLTSQDPEVIPGGVTLFDVQSLESEGFEGAGDLQEIYQNNVFGGLYEQFTNDIYERSYTVARAAAQSGSTNVRGGTARQAFEHAEISNLYSLNRYKELWQAQMAMVAYVIQAVQVSNQIETERWRLKLQAQQLQAGTEQGKAQQILAAAEQVNRDRETHLRTIAAGAEFFGVPQMRTDEDMRGVGYQSGITTSFGMSYWR